MAHSREPTYNVILLGELGVGKTSLFRRLKDNTFEELSTRTVGNDVTTKVFKVDGKNITMSIWDTAGVERHRTLTASYYRNAHAAVLVYSVTDVFSLHQLKHWKEDTERLAPKNVVRILIGNKIDLDPEVDEFTAEQFSKTHTFDKDFMTSCKTGKGVQEAFEALARILHERGRENSTTISDNTVPLGGQDGGGGTNSYMCC